ncbi:MAG: protein kinase [Elusimicrobiota bacterium]
MRSFLRCSAGLLAASLLIAAAPQNADPPPQKASGDKQKSGKRKDKDYEYSMQDGQKQMDDAVLLMRQIDTLKKISANESLPPEQREQIDLMLQNLNAQKPIVEQKPAGDVSYTRPAGYNNLDVKPPAQSLKRDPRPDISTRDHWKFRKSGGDQDNNQDAGARATRREPARKSPKSAGDASPASIPATSSVSDWPAFKKFAEPPPRPATEKDLPRAAATNAVRGAPLRQAEKLLRGNRLPEAEAAARSAMVGGTGDIKAVIILTQSLLEQKRFAEAVESATYATALAPHNADAFFLLALAHEQSGDKELRMQNLRIAAKLDPARFLRYLKYADSRDLFDAEGSSWKLLRDEEAPAAATAQGGSGTNALFMILGALLGVALMAAIVMLTRRRKDPKQTKLDAFGTVAKRLRSWTENVAPKQKTETKTTIISRTPLPPLKLRRNMTIAEKYDLIRFMGYDGTVEIWKAQDQTLGRAALIKRLYAGSKAQPAEERARRLDEARAAAKLRHPNIVDLYEILDIASGLYIVYGYTPGKSVHSILEEVGEFPVGQVRDILIPVCRALEHAHHHGIAHGGLSPERIIVTNKGYIKVSDFVLARTTGEGAERYAAPEAKRGETTPISDIYSLGLCCYEMLTGELPHIGGREPDPRLTVLLERALDLDHRTRMPDVKDFLRMLEQLPDSLADLPAEEEDR